MEKTELPTESRLQDLRDRGIVPYSALTTYCAGAIAALLAVFFQGSNYQETWASFKALSSHSAAFSVPQIIDSLLLKALVCVTLPVVAALIGALLIGVLQTKFLLLGRLLRFELGRCNPFQQDRIKEDKVSVVAELFFVALALVIPTIFYLLLSRDVLAFFNSRLGSIVIGLEALAESGVGIVAFGLTLFAALSWVVSRISFRLKHRMTRQEVESEARE